MEMTEFKALKQFATVGYGNAIVGKPISLPIDIGLQMVDAGLVEIVEETKKEEPKKPQKKLSKCDV